MASLEYRILSRVLREGSLHGALVAGLKEDHFQDIEAKHIWRFINQHWYNQETFRTVPTLSSVQRRWPSFQLMADNPKEALCSLVADLRTASLDLNARRLASEISDLVEVDTSYDAIRKMRDRINELLATAERSEESTIKDVVRHALEHYEGARTGSVYGIPWPWECLTKDTLGKRPGNLIAFYARMKQMKTWIMLYCAAYDYLVNNCRVIIWSREMTLEDLSLRLASIFAKVDYQLFKKGKLPPKKRHEAMEVLNAFLEESDVNDKQMSKDAAQGKRHLLVLAGRSAPKDICALQTVMDKYQPQIVYLDSFYHLKTPGSEKMKQRWERLAALSESAKILAQDNGIPLVVVHQANRLGEKTHGETLSDLADTDVLAREADLIIRILKRKGKELYEEDYELAPKEVAPPKRRVFLPKSHKEETPEEPSNEPPRVGAEIALVLGGNREGVLEALTIHAVPGYNFNLISSDYSTSEVSQWLKEDEEPKKKNQTKEGDNGSSPTPRPKFSMESFKNYVKPN